MCTTNRERQGGVQTTGVSRQGGPRSEEVCLEMKMKYRVAAG